MTFRTSFPALIAIGTLGLIGCKHEAKPEAATTAVANDSASAKAPADDPNKIVVTARTAIYPEAVEKGKSLAVVQAGESVMFLGDSVVAPNKKDAFYKVKLSDGTQGWGRNYGMMLGKPGVFLGSEQLHQRPTLLSPAAGKVELGQLVAIQATQDEFVKVAVTHWQVGWVLASSISTDPAEVTAGALASAAMGKKRDLAGLKLGLAAVSSSSAMARILKGRIDSLSMAQAAAMEKSEPLPEPEPESEPESDPETNRE